jgi:hypothetical protein
MRRFVTVHVVVAAIGLAVIAVCIIALSSPSLVYYYTGTRHAFCRAVRSLNAPHPTSGELKAAVGAGTSVDASGMFHRLAAESPEHFPDGVQDGDSFEMYSFPDVTYYFQFRDGRLVNHHPDEFSETPLKQTTLLR